MIADMNKPSTCACDVCGKPFKDGQTVFYQEARAWAAEHGPSDPINQVWLTCSKTCARAAVKNLDLTD